MMPLGLFRIRAFAGINALTLLLYFGLSGAMFFLPTTLIEAHGYSAARAGSVFLPFTLVMAVLSRMGGMLADRWGAGRLLTFGPLLTGISFALLVPAVANGGFWAAVVPVMVLMGLGMGITVAPLSTVVLNAVAVERAGVTSGINNAISRIAGLVAVSALGAVATFGFQRVGAAAEPGLAQIFAGATFGASLPINGSSETSAALTALYRQATIAGFAWAAAVSSAAALLSAWFGYKLEPAGSPNVPGQL
jgi:predicted MFS family arabinose efflux permease